MIIVYAIDLPLSFLCVQFTTKITSKTYYCTSCIRLLRNRFAQIFVRHYIALCYHVTVIPRSHCCYPMLCKNFRKYSLGNFPRVIRTTALRSGPIGETHRASWIWFHQEMRCPIKMTFSSFPFLELIYKT